ncbi:MAG: hypothetical protein WC975_00620 [Phycisphaerae bacterium]
MNEFCEIQYCESPGAKEVPVSVRKPSDQKRTFCIPCHEAYTIGCQHGGMRIQEMEFWIVAIADRGIVAYVRVLLDETSAWKTVAGYLRNNEGYRGSCSQDAVAKWLDEHDERLSVEVNCQKGISNTQPIHSRMTQTRSDRFLVKDRFILLVKNHHDPSTHGPFEAWAYEGPLDFSKAFPNCFGVGDTIADSLEALNYQLKDWAKGKSNEMIRRDPGGGR